MVPAGDYSRQQQTAGVGDSWEDEVRKVAKWGSIVLGSGLVLLIVAGAVLLALKPWAPKIVVTEPGEGGRRITEDGLLANYYPAAVSSPAILIMGGSEGGLGALSDAVAQQFNQAGYTTLALSYWGGNQQPKRMEYLPLEYFDTAISWLERQPEVNGKIGLFGGSKGAEAALLVASRNPAVDAVVANAPAHVAWAGIDLAEPWNMADISSTWSIQGQPVPYVPYTSGGSFDPLEQYLASLAADPDAVARATIPVEQSRAAILMVCGEEDTLWPSCQMARAVQQRAEAAGRPETTLLAYPDAGHFAQGPPAQPGTEHYDALNRLGGTVAGNQAALVDSWPKVSAFLEAGLR